MEEVKEGRNEKGGSKGEGEEGGRSRGVYLLVTIETIPVTCV